MTDRSENAESPIRFRLRTFGSLTLVDREGNTLLGLHGHHHRRLALLAVLAAAGNSGRARDQLLLLFWPDATQSRARHSLEQLVYAIRGSVDEEIFDGVNPVRLNDRIATSDVADFNDAVRKKDFETAVSLYTGPFLDGFYLTDAPEFEQWLEVERTRLARSYVDALESLAQQAEEIADHAATAKWRRKLAESDPVSSRNALGLIRALASAGDRPAALLYADQYQSLVSRQLSTSVSSEIKNLVAVLREPSGEYSSRPHLAQPPQLGTEPARSNHVTNSSRREVTVETPQRHPRRLMLATLASFILVFGVIGWISVRTRNASPSPRGKSIAVLPFSNVGANPGDVVLGDGLSDAMIGVLARIPDLRVISRTSAFAFRSSTVGARNIGDSLGVTNLLEGSVLKDGSRLRVQVRLVNTKDGSTKWTETYDRNIEDMFAVQSEIASAVAQQLDLQLRDTAVAHIRRGTTANIAAFELFLRGNDPSLTRSDSAARAGLQYFMQAIALDSQYAAAYAGAARLHLRLGYGDSIMSRRERVARAEAFARKALSLDPSLADAHASMGFVHRASLRYSDASDELERAVGLEPSNARLHEWLAQNYVIIGRPGDALREASAASRLDPLSPTATAELARALIANDRCDEALKQLARLKSLRPPLLRAAQLNARCYERKAMWPEAIAELERIQPNGGLGGRAQLAYTLARAGRKDEARKILAGLLARPQQAGAEVADIAFIYVGLGENDRAFEWLDKASAYGDLSPNVEMLLDELRDDPRIDRYRQYLGIQKR